jgi:hypothetical protein
VFIQIDNKEWENIITWDKGCCIPHVIKFTILSNKMTMKGVCHCVKKVMEGATNLAKLIKYYDEVLKHIMLEKYAKMRAFFGPNWK